MPATAAMLKAGSSSEERLFRPSMRLARRDAGLLVLSVMAALSGSAGDGRAAKMSLMESYPAVNEIMDGSATSFALRFDGPVDHQRARFTLIGPMGTRTLRARLNSEPNTLFTAIGKLPPGDYELDWQARAPSGEISEGRIPFHVAPR